jgi:hypothetical protein
MFHFKNTQMLYLLLFLFTLTGFKRYYILISICDDLVSYPLINNSSGPSSLKIRVGLTICDQFFQGVEFHIFLSKTITRDLLKKMLSNNGLS